jgi:hypothetical protein
VTRYRSIGYDFVAIGSDLGLLMRAAQSAVQALRAGDGGPPQSASAGKRTEGGY